ncbi:up-regulated during skeletal muscle growth protein 5 [Fopius arisanus]|uniref:Up-regulated during skeletal muscle growth protein 5 n=1 Tax=Fopius arisanus TaxID=64838 RepID=A0A9R1TN51_9HYME|nr:PREDICTED: up-regulated during skeletal muscle growth protein 5 [Fopius arisanus]
MAHEGENLTGLSKYFNSTTISGRANVAKLTLAMLGLTIVYNVVKPKKNKQTDPAK